MSEIKDYDLLEYLKDEEIYMENINLASCKLVSSEDYGIMLKKCVFQNVIIDGNNGTWGNATVFKECEFRNCIFRGDFGEIYLEWSENFFKDCLFENINIEYGGDISSIDDNGFLNCNFKNVKLNQDIHLLHLTINGGTIYNLSLFSTHMRANLFSNLLMEHVKIQALYNNNIMDFVNFKDVLLEWESEDDNYSDENIFFQCDTNGLTCQKHVGGEYDED